MSNAHPDIIEDGVGLLRPALYLTCIPSAWRLQSIGATLGTCAPPPVPPYLAVDLPIPAALCLLACIPLSRTTGCFYVCHEHSASTPRYRLPRSIASRSIKTLFCAKPAVRFLLRVHPLVLLVYSMYSARLQHLDTKPTISGQNQSPPQRFESLYRSL